MKAILFMFFFSCCISLIAQVKMDTTIIIEGDTVPKEIEYLFVQYQEKRAADIAAFEGFPAADFEAKDIDEYTHRLSYYKGQVVLLVFGNTFCDPCLRQISSLNQLVEEIDSLSLQVLSFVDDSDDEMKAYINKYMIDLKPNYPIIPNSMDFSAISYGGNIGFPRIFIIDKNGLIHKVYTESESYDEENTYKDLKPIILDLLKL